MWFGTTSRPLRGSSHGIQVDGGVSSFDGEFGLQFVTHLANDHGVRDLVAQAAAGLRGGFQQVWVNENVGYRNQFVILSAIAASVPIRVGTAITVPYFHHPLDLVTGLATLSELCDGREIGVGLARGDVGQSTQHVVAVRPVAMVAQFGAFLQEALSGRSVPYGDYPLLVEHFRLRPDGAFTLRFPPAGPFAFYGGGNGPRALDVTGRVLDGMITSGTFLPLLRTGRLQAMVATARRAASDASPGKRLRNVCELNLSVSADRRAAVEFPKRQVSHSVLQWEALGFGDDDYAALGVDRARVIGLREHYTAGGSVEDAAALVTDEMVHACYLAGHPDDVVEPARECLAAAGHLGYEQVVFAKLGPDYGEALGLLSTMLAALR